MKAILLAAGFGTRLRPITDHTPKCLVPINGKPLLEIWLENLATANVKQSLVNTHYLSEQVRAFISASKYKENVVIVFEPELLGTAGTVINNLGFFDNEDGMLIHADNYCEADMSAFIKAHNDRPATCLMTMMTFRTDSPQSCGIVELDKNNVVTGFYEKVATPPGNLANGAVYILSKELLSMLGNELSSVSDFSTEILHRFIGRIYTYETSAVFVDIGTPETYARVNQLHHES